MILVYRPTSVLLCCVSLMLAAFVALSCSQKNPKQTQPTPKSGPDPAVAILDQAIHAHEIRANIAALKAGRVKLFTRGTPRPEYEDRITEEIAFRMPDKLKCITTHIVKTADGHESLARQERVRNGSNAWKKTYDGHVVRDPQLCEPNSFPPFSALYQIKALKNRGFDITLTPPPKDHATTTRTIHVETRGQWVCDVVFDSTTMLLAAFSKPSYDPVAGKRTLAETRFSDYRKVQGIMFPMSTSTFFDGRKFVEKKALEIELLDDLPESTFSEPTSGW